MEASIEVCMQVSYIMYVRIMHQVCIQVSSIHVCMNISYPLPLNVNERAAGQHGTEEMRWGVNVPSSWQRSTAERLGKGDMPYPAYSLFINLHFTDMTNTKLHWAKLIDECRFIERVFDAMRIFPGTRSRGPMTRGFSWRALYPTAMRYLSRFFSARRASYQYRSFTHPRLFPAQNIW